MLLCMMISQVRQATLCLTSHKAFEVHMALGTTTQNRGMRGMDIANPVCKVPN